MIPTQYMRKSNTDSEYNHRDVEIISGSDIAVEPIRWLWKEWLASGKLHILGGSPGVGKTTISMDLAATVTTGGAWPDGTRCDVGNVVIWSGEDDPADTLMPKLLALGADRSRVYFVTSTIQGSAKRPFDPAYDMEQLKAKLSSIGGVQLVIIDPLVSAIAGDSHKNAEVRRGLQPLADAASSGGFALLGITHFTKNSSNMEPVDRITGSLAFGALARIVLVAAKNQQKDGSGAFGIFCRGKSNLGGDEGGFSYDLDQVALNSYPGVVASRILWQEAMAGSARQLLGTEVNPRGENESAFCAAKQFLADLLTVPQPMTSVRAAAKDAGYAWMTIRRARKALGIMSYKNGMAGGWIWYIPTDQPRVSADASRSA
jgi:putative DNA primase/helicase